MKRLLILLLLCPALHAAMLRVAFVGRIDEVHTSHPEELAAGSVVTGSILIHSETTDIQPSAPSYGGYRITHAEIVIGARRFTSRAGSCAVYDDFTFSGTRQDHVAIGAALGAYGPNRDGSIVLRFDNLALDTFASDALSPAIAKLLTLPNPRLEINHDYTSSFVPYARGSLTVLKVDVVPDSALSLLTLGEDKLVISCYRPTPGAGYVLQKSHDLVEWSDLEQILDSSATFQWVDDRFADRIFHRLR